MKLKNTPHVLIVVLLLFTTLTLQATEKFRNTNLSFEERTNNLVSMLTLEEKVQLMRYDSPAIDRLGIPAYNWWNECLHGVARSGLATVFPQAIGMAAMWDKDLMFTIANIISDEARAKYNDYQRQGKRGIYQGLTFWTPNIKYFSRPTLGTGHGNVWRRSVSDC
jgi:beta-glucosidase